MANQTILFTVLPRGLQVNRATHAVSVHVAPRLQGANRLDQFPDWLDWTQRLSDDGLKLTFRCGANTVTRDIDTTVLRPALWQAMFKADTFVRSRTYDDYTDRAIFSYPVRLALSAIKSIYQEASVALALPETEPEVEGDEQRHSPKREFLKGLLRGLAINWSDSDGEGWRRVYRAGFARLGAAGAVGHYDASWLAPDGTLAIVPPAGTPGAEGLNRFVAQQFGVYTHMPQGAPIRDNPPDFDKLIDFHQALSSVGSYPALLRALGIVFDFELPADFVAMTALAAHGTLAVVDIPGRVWSITTRTAPPLETAYIRFAAGDATHPFTIFTTAPGLLGGVLPELDVFGLLNLDPTRYGLAQVDVESGMHKATLLAESWQDSREGQAFPDRPDVFDETTTLPSLRSGGFSLYADARALRLLKSFQESRKHNDHVDQGTPLTRPLFAEELTQGYRIDIFDSSTDAWHSLHRRKETYDIEGVAFAPADEQEGFTELAAAQAAPDPANPPPNDLYVNESVARWAGWSLSVPFPGKALSRDADPAKALVDDPAHPPNEPATPFKITTQYQAVAGSLPALRFGRSYRLRVRAVDLAGNSLLHDDPMAAVLAVLSGLPRGTEGFPYLRYEPVAAPTVVLRDERGVTGPGSLLYRLVIRTSNSDVSKDTIAADLTASDRFIVPPSTSVEMGERLGMFDKAGKLDASAAMYQLIGDRDKGRLPEVDLTTGGKTQKVPLVAVDAIDELPYLPDVLARGAALRNLPGATDHSVASVAPGAGALAPLAYQPLADANPRAGSAALVSFGGEGDWQNLLPFRLALADGSGPPTWDPAARILTVSLPKGTQFVVPLSGHLGGDDLKRMGVWQWLRERIDRITVQSPDVPVADARVDSEKIAHLLQRAQEGGHWMLTPPRLLTLVHAVQQPLGVPAFTAISVQHAPYGRKTNGGTDEMVDPDPNVLQTAPESRPTAASELAPITAWRRPGSPEAVLLGGLQIHAASTEKVDLLAQWSDPYDDPQTPRVEGTDYRSANSTRAEEVPVPSTREGFITVHRNTVNARRVAYYDADHDLLCFARAGDRLGNLASGTFIGGDAAPRHYFNDTRYHRVTYTARATSRFREYFPPHDGDPMFFARDSAPVVVDVPASARPSAPQIDYVVPTFGWQRQTQTNLKRSVRFGGGLRVYLERPWFSSGDGELLGVALYDGYSNGMLSDREAWKSTITQWGADPIWSAPSLGQLPSQGHFINRVADELSLSLPGRVPGRVGVAGFAVAFDYERQKWFADLVVDVQSLAYTPFMRLALVRYQPFALPDAKLSAVVLADFMQLTPERSAVITADPYHPQVLRLTLSGPAPSGPPPRITGAHVTHPIVTPTIVVVTVQRRDATIQSDIAWHDAPADATVVAGAATGLVRWTGTVTFAKVPEPGTHRLLIREYECLSANYTVDSVLPGGRRVHEQPMRLIYAETIDIDAALVSGPASATGTTLDD
jgi:hypothetical protein